MSHRLFASAAAICMASACSAPDEFVVRYHEATSSLRVSMSEPLAAGHTLHLRARRGRYGELSCAQMADRMPAISATPIADAAYGRGPTYQGPTVDRALLQPFYNANWLEHPPTPEMLAKLAGGTDAIVDVCEMNGSQIVRQLELDLASLRAKNQGKADGTETRANTVEDYAALCVKQMGEIPFFPKLADGSYGTYNCLDSVKIPMTVTDAQGNVTEPTENVSTCDNPQYIYSLCETGPRVARRTNAEGTNWVLLCRKSKGGLTSSEYNDIAMIGHNPFTGKTCYFQNALYSKTDGAHVPHPADKEKSKNLWSGIQGGIGSGIECARCHDADPFIHSPWIDGAKDEHGNSVVPKMGEHPDYGIGYNSAPYAIVNLKGQGWTMPKQLVDERAQACTRCHRIGNGRWAQSWITRLQGTDSAWNNITTEHYKKFPYNIWMPPASELAGIDAEHWPDSKYAKAMKFIEACGDNPSDCQWADIPSQPNQGGPGDPVQLDDDALAVAALKAVGAKVAGSVDRCSECHAVGRSGIRNWYELTKLANGACFKDDMTPLQKVDCLRVDPSDSTSHFEAIKAGIWAAGANLYQLRKLFQDAYPAGENGNTMLTWAREYSRFKSRVGMPKGNHPQMSQREFNVVLEWFKRALPKLDEKLPEPPPPSTCEDNIGPLASHIQSMKLTGWGAVNRDRGMNMFGCNGATDPLKCLTSFERMAGWENPASGATVRKLHEYGFRTSFWTRSSADGRYVGNGGGKDGRSTITDLIKGTDIKVEASYDPGFFPDNSGFVFQGTGNGAGFCTMSLLDKGPTQITFNEPECVGVRGVALYQHVGAGLGGGDYFVINSQFVSDNGGHGATSSDPSATFGPGAKIKITPMLFDGTNYKPLEPISLETPYEGDSVLSPSSTLLAARLTGPNSKQIGYVLRKVIATPAGSNYAVSVPQVGRICLRGAKPNFSFDERFIVTHHYVEANDWAMRGFSSAEDPGFKALRDKGASDIWVADLLTGQKIRITNMPAGVYALYPHFRSDGWFYFTVRDNNSDKEYLAASDAAARLAAQ